MLSSDWKMKNIIKFTAILSLLFVFTQCGNRHHIDYTHLGQNLCNCSQELKEKNIRFQELITKKQTEKAMVLMDTLGTLENNLKACILEENKKADFLNDSKLTEELPQSLNKICPDRTAKILELVKELK